MLSGAEQQLFFATRKAQLTRNNAICILSQETSRSQQIIEGSLVRVLIEIPLESQQDYAIAQVEGTVEGESYSGFSMNTAQETNLYLVIRLPRRLAAINGNQFQLNSVSNSGFSEAEFVRWVHLTREEGVPLPSIAELNRVSECIRPYDVMRRARVEMLFARNLSGSVGVNAHAAPLVLQHSAQRSPMNHLSQTRRLSLSSQQETLAQSNVAGRPHMHSLRSASEALREGDFERNTPPPRADAVLINYFDQHSPSYSHPISVESSLHSVGLVLQGGGRGGFHAPDLSDDAATASNATPLPPASLRMDRMPLGGSNSNHDPQQPETLQLSTTQQVESEDAEMERRLRQDITNHLQQTCTLFTKDPKGYKLSQLRLIERDMIEYLQHVRDEIVGKQENCVVCMDHVPTVILLPCRHKVLCRLCAPSCAACPVCRSGIKEMFEPTEI